MSGQQLKRKLASLKQANFSASQLIIFVVAFAAIGYLLFRTFASAPVVATVEAEQMSLPVGATVYNDSTASAGQAVKLNQTGTLTGSVNLPSQADSLTLTAKQTKCRNLNPSFSLAVDGATLLSSKVSTTSWSGYSVTKSLAAGTHSLTITVTNASKGNCTTTMYLDLTTFFGPAPPPTPAPTVTLSASPTSLSPGGSSTLTWNSTNANSCTASGAWSGSEPLSGSTSTGALNTTSTYSLTCTGDGGQNSASTTVTVSSSATIPATTVAHTTDGNLSETDWVLNGSVTKCVVGTTCNNTTTFGAMWDNTYLYVGVKVLDSALYKDSASCWDDDSVEVYIDPNNDGGTSYDGLDKQLTQRYNDSNLCGNSAGSTAGVLHSWASVPGGYTVEMAIPWSSLGVAPVSGMTVALDVGNNDDDDGTTRDTQAVAYGTSLDYTNPSGFGKLSLSGTGMGTPPPPPPPSNGTRLVGFSSHIPTDPTAADTYVSKLKAAHITAVRDDLPWSWTSSAPGSYNWSRLNTLCNVNRKYGLKLVVQIGFAPKWANGGNSNDKVGPLNPSDYGTWAKDVALKLQQTCPDVIHGIEYWNEPNISFLLNPNAGNKAGDPLYYTQLANAAYNAVKAAGVTIPLWGGATAGVGQTVWNGPIDWTETCLKAGIKFDQWSSHPYYSTTGMSGTTFSRMDVPTAFNMTFFYSSLETLDKLLARYGYNGPIHATEVGVPTDAWPSGTRVDYPKGVGTSSESAQVDWFNDVWPLWSSKSRAGDFYIYTGKDSCSSCTTTREDHYGAFRSDWSAKPLVSKLQAIW